MRNLTIKAIRYSRTHELALIVEKLCFYNIYFFGWLFKTPWYQNDIFYICFLLTIILYTIILFSSLNYIMIKEILVLQYDFYFWPILKLPFGNSFFNICQYDIEFLVLYSIWNFSLNWYLPLIAKTLWKERIFSFTLSTVILM